MAYLKVRQPVAPSTLDPINPDLAIDVQSIPGLFGQNCIINPSMIPAVNNALAAIPGVKVKDLKLEDLMFPAYYSNGIYIFYDLEEVFLSRLENYDGNPEKIVYIGKAGGRTFIERIAAHFASRDNDFMNNMLKKIAQILFGGKTDVEIDKSFMIAKNFYLKIIYFPAKCQNVSNCIAQLEKELITYYKPILNK